MKEVWRPGWRTAAAVVVALLGGLAACGGEDGQEPSDTAAADGQVADVGPSPAPEPAEEQALQAYRDSNDYMERALAEVPPDPLDPELADHFSGSALNDNTDILFQARQNHEYFDSTLDSDPVVVTVTSSEVVLSDCVTETATGFDAVTGQQTSSGSTVRDWQIRVVKTDAGWRVDEITPQEETCTP